MKPVKFIILCTMLAATTYLAGCSDKDDADKAKSEGSLIDQAKEMTSSAADSAKQAAADAGTAMSNAADSTQEAVKDAADQTGAAMDSGMAAAGNAADSAAATGNEMADSAAATTGEAADATAAAADSTMEAGKQGADDAMAAAGAAGAAVADKAQEATAAAADMVAPAASADSTGADLAQGQTIYQGKCQACHATGAAGAPKFGDKANWAPRIAQGMDTLVKHALEGFKGSVGYMPPKGGFTALSDDEVKAAVAYMVSQNQ